MSEYIRLPRGLPDEAYQLGEAAEEFSFGGGRLAGKVVGGLLALLVGIGLVVLDVVLIVAVTDNPGPGGGSGRGFGCLAIFAAVLIFTGIAVPVRALRQQGMRVWICPDGLVFAHGEVSEVIRWDDVKTVRQEVGQRGYDYRGIYPLYKVRRRSDGREFVFDNFLPRVRALGRLIERKTLKYMLPDQLEAFDEGEVLRFGPLALGRKGIRKGDDWLPWDEVKEVTFDKAKGRIVISKQDKWLAWHRQLINEVPNYHVFLEIAHEEMRR